MYLLYEFYVNVLFEITFQWISYSYLFKAAQQLGRVNGTVHGELLQPVGCQIRQQPMGERLIVIYVPRLSRS